MLLNIAEVFFSDRGAISPLCGENRQKVSFIGVFGVFAADEHDSHQELVRRVGGPGTPETDPLHGETVCSGTSGFIQIYYQLL